MNLLERLHGGYIQQKRLDGLVRHLKDVIPKHASVLDVGCGDGRLAVLLREKRADLVVEGIEVLQRDKVWIPVQHFDGVTIPYKSASLDVVMFIDVLHHTEDPVSILREAARVARKSIVIKDHLNEGLLAEYTLRFMDRIGNARYGIALTGNYWRQRDWEQAFITLGMNLVEWREQLGLYPPVLDLLFGRSLHFVAKLDVRQAA